MVEALTSTLRRLESRADVRAVVLTGAGRNFCAGADIEHMKRSAAHSREQNLEAARATSLMLHTLYSLEKPTIACVRGAVRGGGVGLVTAFAFSYLPLQQAQTIKPVVLFRSKGLAAPPIEWRQLLLSWQVLPLVLAAIAFIWLAVLMTNDPPLVAAFVAVSLFAAVLFRFAVALMAKLIERLPEPRNAGGVGLPGAEGADVKAIRPQGGRQGRIVDLRVVREGGERTVAIERWHLSRESGVGPLGHEVDAGETLRRGEGRARVDHREGQVEGAGHRAALRAFPPMVPETPDADGAAVSRQAREFWSTQWQGRSMMAIGAKDPVLGPPLMHALRRLIRGCPEPVVLPQAGHFVQEHGEPVARAAVGYFGA